MHDFQLKLRKKRIAYKKYLHLIIFICKNTKLVTLLNPQIRD